MLKVLFHLIPDSITSAQTSADASHCVADSIASAQTSADALHQPRRVQTRCVAAICACVRTGATLPADKLLPTATSGRFHAPFFGYLESQS